MEECYICFSSLESSHFKSLPCSHKICFTCYLKLDKTKCPLCRKDFKYNKEDIIKRKELGIQNKYNSPSARQNYDERTRINDLNSLNYYPNHYPNHYSDNYPEDFQSTRSRNNDYNVENIGIVGRQRYRKRRKNLTEEEIKEKRKIIRGKCRRKWTIKENRLSKTNWYDITV
jgi:hypothetical protein